MLWNLHWAQEHFIWLHCQLFPVCLSKKYEYEKSPKSPLVSEVNVEMLVHKYAPRTLSTVPKAGITPTDEWIMLPTHKEGRHSHKAFWNFLWDGFRDHFILFLLHKEEEAEDEDGQRVERAWWKGGGRRYTFVLLHLTVCGSYSPQGEASEEYGGVHPDLHCWRAQAGLLPSRV